jgi:hypothetical protein
MMTRDWLRGRIRDPVFTARRHPCVIKSARGHCSAFAYLEPSHYAVPARGAASSGALQARTHAPTAT